MSAPINIWKIRFHMSISTHLIFPVVDQQSQEHHSIIPMLPSAGHIWQDLTKGQDGEQSWPNQKKNISKTIEIPELEYSLTCRMASKMLLIITYSSIVFWLMLSVTCWHIFSTYLFTFRMFFQNSTRSIPQCWSQYNESFRMFCLTVTRHSSSLRQRLFRLSEPPPHRRLSSLSIKSCRSYKTWSEWTPIIPFTPLFPLGVFFAPRTFILCSALSKPMSMLMMSKPEADLFFWWTPRKSAQSVWREPATQVLCVTETQLCIFLAIRWRHRSKSINLTIWDLLMWL